MKYYFVTFSMIDTGFKSYSARQYKQFEAIEDDVNIIEHIESNVLYRNFGYKGNYENYDPETSGYSLANGLFVHMLSYDEIPKTHYDTLKIIETYFPEIMEGK